MLLVQSSYPAFGPPSMNGGDIMYLEGGSAVRQSQLETVLPVTFRRIFRNLKAVEL